MRDCRTFVAVDGEIKETDDLVIEKEDGKDGLTCEKNSIWRVYDSLPL